MTLSPRAQKPYLSTGNQRMDHSFRHARHFEEWEVVAFLHHTVYTKRENEGSKQCHKSGTFVQYKTEAVHKKRLI
jgi:hypothetical protein